MQIFRGFLQDFGQTSGCTGGHTACTDELRMQSQPGGIDPTDLLAACRSGSTVNLALLHEILGHFVRQNRSRVSEAQRALARDDRDTLTQIAHAMKGSAALVGARRLSHLAYELELDAPSAPATLLQTRVRAVEQEFAAVLHTLSIEHPGALVEPPEGV